MTIFNEMGNFYEIEQAKLNSNRCEVDVNAADKAEGGVGNNNVFHIIETFKVLKYSQLLLYHTFTN